MTSSPDRALGTQAAAIEPLPPAFSSMWRLCRLGYSYEPRLMLAAFVLSQLAALPDALLALWIMWLGRGIVEGRASLVMSAAIGLGVTAPATWILATVSTRVQRRFRDKVTIALESHVARLQASVSTIAHHERPDFLDRLAMLRNQVFVLDHMYMSLFTTCGWVLRLIVTVILLASIHPALALLVVFALPAVFASTWRPAVERTAQERGAQSHRRARHLFTTATTAPPGKEVRVTGIGPRLAVARREAWERGYAPIASARWTSAAWHSAAWAIFALGYVGAIVFVSSVLAAPAADVLLVLAAGSRLSAYVSATVGELGFLRGFWMDGSRRLAWLEDYAASVDASADQPAAGRAGPWHPVGAGVVRVPGHRETRARRRVAHAAGRIGDCARRRKRRGQDDVGETAGEDVRADVRRDSPRRLTARTSLGDGVARTHVGCVPGFLPVRVPGTPDRRPRRSPSHRRRHRGEVGGLTRRRRRSRRPPASGPRHAARPHLAGRRRGVVRPVAEARPGTRLHARRSRCCSCSTNRPRRSTRNPSTRCSSATPRRRAAPSATAASRCWCRTAFRRSAWPISSSSSMARGSSKSGSHEELMARGGQYSELYGIQAAAYR